jgi:hypothetical protein
LGEEIIGGECELFDTPKIQEMAGSARELVAFMLVLSADDI